MKRSILFFLLCQWIALGAFAQTIKIQKTTLVPNESGTFHVNQAAALNTKTGQTLFVWQKLTSTGSVVLARLIGVQGNAVSGQFQLSVTANAAHPAVAYNPVRNEFLVAYDDNPNVQAQKSSIILRRLSARGQPIAGEVNISTDADSAELANLYGRLAFNPATGGYCAIWLREVIMPAQVGKGVNGMVGMVVTPTGTPGGTPVLIQKTVIESTSLYSPTTLDVMIHPASGKLLVAFVQILSGTGGAQANYYLATLNATLTGITSSNIVKINNAPVQLSNVFLWGARLALFRTTPGFVFYVDSFNVRRRKIDLQGKLTGTSVVAFKPPKNNTLMVYPAVAFSTNAKGTRGLLIATEDPFDAAGAATVWAQILSSTGVPLGAPVKVDVTSASDTAVSSVLGPLPLKPTDTTFRYSLFYSLVQFTSPGQTYQNAGIVKLNLNVTVP